MQIMKEILTSLKGKNLDMSIEDGVIRIHPKPDGSPTFPHYRIHEVGTDVFEMVFYGAKQANGTSRYYRIDKVLEVGPFAL
jgi:hypothetical protein